MNPYEALGDSSFWRTGVAEREPRDIANLSRPKARLSRTDAIGTAGSCFAQHIGRNLRGRGFRVVDVEPAPPLLAQERHAAYGFGLFSARYGNVYTTAQLRQLLLRAFGKFEPVDAAWEEDGNWFDPFRPTIEPGGFSSQEELRLSIASHLGLVRSLIRQIDVFVFTLGLTEAWRSRDDGAVYPMCPGTSAGSFDPERHEFVNYTYSEVAEDLEWCIRFLRRVRPNMRFIFTVSPVPLTATASGDHVLTATTYSKSVLRAVAGDTTRKFDFADYFPSYEIIMSPVFRGAFFEANLRSVTPEGVDFVMSKFFEEFCIPDCGQGVGDWSIDSPEGTESRSQEDTWCDEETLEAYS